MSKRLLVFILVTTLLTGIVVMQNQHPKRPSGTGTRGGSLIHDEYTVAYWIVSFPDGESGLLVVARKHADAVISMDEVQEGVAIIDIDRKRYTLELSNTHKNPNDIRAIF